MCTRIKLPFFKIEIKHASMFYYILLNLIFIVIPAIGYIMNFQNLWEYFPPEEAFTNLESFYTIVSMKFIVACIGVFISPVGTIAGFIWQEKHAMNFFSFVRDSFSFKNKKKTETKKQKPYKNPCDDVKFGDIVIGRSFSEKLSTQIGTQVIMDTIMNIFHHTKENFLIMRTQKNFLKNVQQCMQKGIRCNRFS